MTAGVRQQLGTHARRGATAAVRRFYALTAVCYLSLGLAAPMSVGAELPSSADIKNELVMAMGEEPPIGVVVGVIDSHGMRVISHGQFDRDDKRPVDGDTIFEIGSVSKVFTTLLLGEMVARGEVKLDDRVDRYLPEGVTTPKRAGKSMTLVDLATHTSGLPRLPGNLKPADMSDPYADYTPDKLYAFLSSYQLPRDIGATYEYSNLGMGLLGDALARRAAAGSKAHVANVEAGVSAKGAAGADASLGTTKSVNAKAAIGVDGEAEAPVDSQVDSATAYDAALRERVTGPLGMTDTAVALSPSMQARLAPGHDGDLKRVPGWHMGALQGAGALHSSAKDLLKLMMMAMGDPSSPLARAMAITLATERDIADSEGQIALGWHVDPESRGGMVWHNGSTGGYSAFIGFLPITRTGVVVLANVRPVIGVDDIGRRLLMSGMMSAAEPPSAQRVPIDVPGEVLERYVGRYRLTPEFALEVTREGDALFVQATGQQRFRVHAESSSDFFYTVVDAQISFVTPGEKGAAVRMVLHQNGRDMVGERIEK
jgi:CubicO group peptidase (beta-lactamase class C family)